LESRRGRWWDLGRTQQRKEKPSTNIGKYSVQIIIKHHYKVACVIIENKYDNRMCSCGLGNRRKDLEGSGNKKKNKHPWH